MLRRHLHLPVYVLSGLAILERVTDLFPAKTKALIALGHQLQVSGVICARRFRRHVVLGYMGEDGDRVCHWRREDVVLELVCSLTHRDSAPANLPHTRLNWKRS